MRGRFVFREGRDGSMEKDPLFISNSKVHRFVWQSVILCVLYVLFLLQDSLAGYFGLSIFAQYDEIMAVLGCCLVFVSWAKKRFRLTYPGLLVKSVGIYLLMIVIGLVSNLSTGYQDITYILLDILTCSKLYIGLICAITIFPSGMLKKTKRALAKITALFIIVYFVLAIHDFFLTPLLGVLYDGGLKCIQLAYSNVTYLAGYGTILLAVLVLTKEYQKHFFLLAIFISITICLTFRSKAMGFVCFAWILYLALRKGNERISNNKLFIVVPFALMGTLFIAWDKIVLYYFEPSQYSPRNILFNIAVELATKHFPLGTGFGTFCSVASISNISPIYGHYGYNYFSAVYDMFWGCLLGQFGFVGTVLFIMSIVCMAVSIWKIQNKSKNAFFCGVFLLLYLCIASLGECSFFSPYSIGYGFIIGLAIQEGRVWKRF